MKIAGVSDTGTGYRYVRRANLVYGDCNGLSNLATNSNISRFKK